MFLEKNKRTCPFIREVKVVQMLSRFYKKFEIFINMSLMDKLEVNPAQYSFGQYGVCKSKVLIEGSFGCPSLLVLL